MLKTGLVGNMLPPELDIISRHPGFQIAGCYFPEKHEGFTRSRSMLKFPELSKSVLLQFCDVLIIGPGCHNDISGLLSEALKKSRHILLLDMINLHLSEFNELMKLQEEAQTVVQINQRERSSPALQESRHLVVHPCMIDIKMVTPEQEEGDAPVSVSENISRMLDALLFLCPLNIRKIQTARLPLNMSFTCLLSVRIEFDNGTVANLLSANVPDETFKIDVYQKCRLLKIDLLSGELVNLETSGKHNNSIPGEFKEVTGEQSLGKELDRFYESVMSSNYSDRELYEVFRIAELSRRIIAKSGFPVTT